MEIIWFKNWMTTRSNFLWWNNRISIKVRPRSLSKFERSCHFEATLEFLKDQSCFEWDGSSLDRRESLRGGLQSFPKIQQDNEIKKSIPFPLLAHYWIMKIQKYEWISSSCGSFKLQCIVYSSKLDNQIAKEFYNIDLALWTSGLSRIP